MLKTKKLKSPLRYPGGKSRAVDIVRKRIPKDVKVVVSPFFGGGSIELYLAQDGVKVIGYDGFKPLARFWQEILRNPNFLANKIYTYFPLSKEDFYLRQKQVRNTISEGRDVSPWWYFILNRSSFSGTTLRGGCSNPSARFTLKSIINIRDFVDFPKDVLTVEYSLWEDTLAKHTDEFMYLDPPYIIESKIYGVRGDMQEDFDHDALAKVLLERTSKWLLSYNDCPTIRELYKSCTIEEVSWSYGMSDDKYKGELLIRNY